VGVSKTEPHRVNAGEKTESGEHTTGRDIRFFNKDKGTGKKKCRDMKKKKKNGVEKMFHRTKSLDGRQRKKLCHDTPKPQKKIQKQKNRKQKSRNVQGQPCQGHPVFEKFGKN